MLVVVIVPKNNNENGREDGFSTNLIYTEGTEYVSRMNNSLPYVRCVCYYYIVPLLIAEAKFTLSDNVMFRLIPNHNRSRVSFIFTCVVFYFWVVRVSLVPLHNFA